MRTLHGWVAVLSLVVAGCGGGGGDPAPSQQASIQPSDTGLGNGPSSFLVGEIPEAGDSGIDLALTGLLRFPLAAVPAGAQVLSAEVHATEKTVGDPFGAFGALTLEVFDGGAALDVADLGAAALAGTGAASFNGAIAPDVVRVIDVTDFVQAARAAGLSNLDLRLAAAGGGTDGDGAEDGVLWIGPEFPVLVVTFVP